MSSFYTRYIGKVFGKLTVIAFDSYKQIEIKKSGKIKRGAFYLCKCSCGESKIVFGNYLRKGTVKSCGCLPKEALVERNKKRRKLDTQFNRLYSAYRAKANYKSILFELSREEFKEITSKNCYYCGIIPLQKASILSETKKRAGNYVAEYLYNGIDRIDSDFGYTLNNIRPCCGICNKAKRDLSDEDFQVWLDRLTKYQFSLKTNND